MALTERILYGHRGDICDLALQGEILVSASCDCHVGVWDLEEATLLYMLEGHRNDVNCVALSGRRCVSGDDDGIIISVLAVIII